MTTNTPVLRFSAAAALIFGFTLGLYGAGGHRAHLSLDLTNYESRHRPDPARVIVHGSRAEVEALAARHHLTIARVMDDSAVLLANSAQVTELAADPASDALSGDLPVTPFMSVSNGSTAADQTRGGK